MNKLLLILLVLIGFSQCKKDNPAPEPLPEVASIVGKWRVIAYGRTVGDSLVTEPVPAGERTVYEFRYDGMLLNEKGYLPCCISQRLVIDGKLFVPKPLGPVESDPSCIFLDCAPCPQVSITRPTADNLLIEPCTGIFMTLAREK
ncbi:hypothetical protein [Dyadobacter sp. CY343]|uniref:hypothetical protein n=1 Tax=Dyadobacter sp. CY343 TaxID=2907299 RepID=UPI001F219529|nr:hypothetical protein [Dyadobacter sp. CY343]MCE7060300.1 hypothetical protein [Dyadobacter sp. CY343]